MSYNVNSFEFVVERMKDVFPQEAFVGYCIVFVAVIALWYFVLLSS